MLQSLLRLHWIDQPQADALHCYDKQQHLLKDSKLWMTYYWLLLPRKFWIVDKHEEFAFLPHNTFCLYHQNFCRIMTVVCHFPNVNHGFTWLYGEKSDLTKCQLLKDLQLFQSFMKSQWNLVQSSSHIFVQRKTTRQWFVERSIAWQHRQQLWSKLVVKMSWSSMGYK